MWKRRREVTHVQQDMKTRDFVVGDDTIEKDEFVPTREKPTKRKSKKRHHRKDSFNDDSRSGASGDASADSNPQGPRVDDESSASPSSSEDTEERRRRRRKERKSASRRRESQMNRDGIAPSSRRHLDRSGSTRKNTSRRSINCRS